ncbi:hypothetical protein GCM10025868_43240 [Angustibacter aerolatus]|uniref:Secreted protein n=1 Tax=Angustibacter aerolatus TaxID=1162965 RepID=A0ABQ6JPK3_9ACTN|nr:hypothetical protein GCM10025868_43240 [Angustibacter aerolatus]
MYRAWSGRLGVVLALAVGDDAPDRQAPHDDADGERGDPGAVPERGDPLGLGRRALGQEPARGAAGAAGEREQRTRGERTGHHRTTTLPSHVTAWSKRRHGTPFD